MRGGDGGVKKSCVEEFGIEADSGVKTGNQIVVKYTFIHLFQPAALRLHPPSSRHIRLQICAWTVSHIYFATFYILV